MPITKLRPSFTLTEDRLNELKAVVPEAFADGKINWETLREALGEHLEDAGPDAEHFGLFWPGKREARRLAAKPSKGALIPAPGEGVDEATTRNLFIEGDNLEVLKLLQKSYAGRVKMIYIDPPYNTGNDFIYSDNFADPLDDYLRKTGQMGEEGEMLTSNPKAGGRFHSNWLSMMYPRLLLARRLLKDDGLIFVSIDENEMNFLAVVLDEVFGEENRIATIVWKKAYGGGAKAKYIVGLHEYILCYAKRKESIEAIVLPPDPETRRYYTRRDDKFEVRGPYRTQPLATNSMDPRPNLRFAIHWQGHEIWPEKQWQWSQERVANALENDELVFTNQEGRWAVYYKQYLLNEDSQERGSKPYSVLDGPYTQKGTGEIEQLFSDGKTFPFPKPSDLLKQLLCYIWQDKDAIVLDYFAGSATTAHAVLQVNQAESSNRRFILVQLPEPTNNPKFPTIAEIGKERIRRVIKHMRADNSRAQTAIPLDGNRQSEIENPKSEDLGFKVFKLGRSSYKGWQDYEGDDVSQLETLFDAHESPLVKGWKPEHLLAETMLIEGFPLDSAVTPQTQFARNRVVCVASDACAHRLFACFNDAIDDDTVAELRSGKHLREDDVFICLDSALSDEAKLRLSDAVKVHVI